MNRNFIFLLVLLYSCGSTGVHEKKNAITGTYIHQSESEFSKAMDTLVVTPSDVEGGTYVIIRKTGFNRINDGKIQPREFRQEKMITVWDAGTRRLQEVKKGLFYLFSASGTELIAGTTKYQKIKL